jgi:hypothetical protein
MALDIFIQRQVEFIKRSLSFQRVFKHYNWNWETDEDHQLSCPFHARFIDKLGRPFEEHPSAKYYSGTKSLYCFTCNFVGDILGVIRRKENLTLEEAIKFTSEKFDVQVDTEFVYEGPDPISEDKAGPLAKFWNDEANDLLYRVCQTDKAIEAYIPNIFKVKWIIEDSVKSLSYFEAVGKYREWFKAVKQLVEVSK